MNIFKFLIDNKDFIDVIVSILGGLASIATISGVIIAIVEFYKSYKIQISASHKAGKVYHMRDQCEYYALITKIKNIGSFDIPVEEITLSTQDYASKISCGVSSLDKNEFTLIRKSTKVCEFPMNFVFLSILAKEDMKNNLKERLYVTVKTVNKTYRFKTPYTIGDMLNEVTLFEKEKAQKENKHEK